jgi:hypothetical protein
MNSLLYSLQLCSLPFPESIFSSPHLFIHPFIHLHSFGSYKNLINRPPELLMEQLNLPNILRLPRELRDEIYIHLFTPITSIPVKVICRDSGLVLSAAESRPIFTNVVTNKKARPTLPKWKKKILHYIFRTKPPTDLLRDEAFAMLDQAGQIQEIGCRFYKARPLQDYNISRAAMPAPDRATSILRTNRQIATEAWEIMYGMLMKRQVLSVTGYGKEVYRGSIWGLDQGPPNFSQAIQFNPTLLGTARGLLLYSQAMHLQPNTFRESNPFSLDKMLDSIHHLSKEMRQKAGINRLDISFKRMDRSLIPQRHNLLRKDVEYLLMTFAVDPIKRKADIIWCVPPWPDCREPANMTLKYKELLEEAMQGSELIFQDDLFTAVWFARQDYDSNGEHGEWRIIAKETGYLVM